MTDSTKTAASPRRRFALWQGAAALSTLALVPLATGAMATVDSKTTDEISRFMDVFLEVKSNYVVAPLPQLDPASPQTLLNSYALAVTAGSTVAKRVAASSDSSLMR